MDISGDYDLFLADFGANCLLASTAFKGILDTPDQVVLDGVATVTEYLLTYKTSAVALVYGSAITVGGVAYTVDETRMIDDGIFSKASLKKV